VKKKKMPSLTERSDWFVRDRFGLFIHWGIYSLPARHEWVKSREQIPDDRYQRYFDRFDPDLYDPKAWAREARNAGMKYFVVTTKHHDGFCLWDSKLTEYKATRSPAGRDLIKPMVKAFRREGMKVGFYHSLLDWHHPEYSVDMHHPLRDDRKARQGADSCDPAKYARYLHGQTRELLSNYGPIDVMWFDFSYSQKNYGKLPGKGKDHWQSEELMKMVRRLQPNILVNDRLEIGGDLVTPEQYQPRGWVERGGKRVLWEACQTLNGSWGYHRDNHDWKSVDMLVKMLIDTVSKGGNLLLNVGPNARGEFEPRALERLRGIGEWMRLHERSIYECTASEFKAPVDCRYTQNGNRLYLHLFSWPFKHVHLEGLSDRFEYAQLLNDASEIPFHRNDPAKTAQNVTAAETAGTVTLTLPIVAPNVAIPVIDIHLKK
jgi:alpha-L-fucosidase